MGYARPPRSIRLPVKCDASSACTACWAARKTKLIMSRAIAANRILNKIRIFSRRGSAWSTDQLILSRCNQRLLKMETSGSQQRQKSSAEPRRFARPDEVNYALRQDMGEGYTRRTVEISALGTKYNMVYGEWVPVDRPVEGCPAVICIHGTPATEGAYRPIGSKIASGGRGYRVLAVNFPGMGYTQNDPERRYNYSTSGKVELVKAFITALQLERLQRLTLRLPYATYILYRALYIPMIGWFIRYLCSKYSQFMGFRGKTKESQVLSIYEVSQRNFSVFHQNLLRISERRLPVLLFYSFNDTVVESELLQENIDVLQIPEADIKDYDANGLSEHVYQDGTLRRVVRFAAGTHRLQFTNPEKTSTEIVSLLDALGKR